MPKISVIIPVYKAENTLSRCIDSVLSQTFTDHEVILVDDGSPDKSGEICDRYALEHENITVIHQENSGVSAARNRGLETARSEYVMFLDSDDYLTGDCLETLYGSTADLVVGTIFVMTPSGVPTEQKHRGDRMLSFSELSTEIAGLMEENRMNYLHAKLFRRSILMRHDIRFEDYAQTAAEDTVFVFRFLPYCETIFISGKPVHYYTYNPSGLAHRDFLKRIPRGARLWRFLTEACRDMDLYTDEVKRVIDVRYLTYMDTMLYRLPKQRFSDEEKMCFAREMEKQTHLRELLRSYPASFEALDYLFTNGSDAYVRYSQREYSKQRMTRPFRRAAYLIRIYTRELLMRLKIIKRKEDNR